MKQNVSREAVQQSLFKVMKNGNIKIFSEELKRMGLDLVQNQMVLDDSVEEYIDAQKKYTLLQYAVKNGLAEMVLALLEFGVDPNISDAENETRPVLLAAEYGHYHILQIFKDYTKTKSERGRPDLPRQSTKLDLACQKIGMELSALSFTCSVDFSVFKQKTKETVLHLIFRRPVLSNKIIKSKRIAMLSSHSTQSFKKEQRKTLLELDKNYLKCAHVLLEEHFMHNSNIVNFKDCLGNTPLHYATSNNWPQLIVKKLLYVGANITTTNKKHVMPLTRIPKDTLNDFMDDYCVTVDDFDDDTDEEDTPYQNKDPEDDDNMDFLQEYDPSFLTNTAELPVQFNYRFLAPEFNYKHKLQKNMGTMCGSTSLVSEMDVLDHISRSKEHEKLVTHPVIKSYIWLKWKIISKMFHRNLRLRLYYVYVLTWFILSQYGGYQWRQNECLFQKEKMHEDFCVASKSPIQAPVGKVRSFCDDPKFTFTFEEGYHLPCIYKNPLYIGYVFVALIVGLGAFGAFKDDFLRKWYDHEGFFKMNRKMIMLFIACWIDFWTFVLIGLVLWKSEVILMLVITIILSLTLSREMHQLLSLKLVYLKQPGKWFDLFHFALVIILLYVPNDKLTDPLNFSSPRTFKTLCEAGIKTIEDWNVDNCSIKRCLAGFTIVFAWGRLLVTIVKHPYLQRYNIYLQMLSKVTRSFMKFLFWYSFFIVSFVLGFYVMLHNDVGKSMASLRPLDSANDTKDMFSEAFEEFNHPIEATMKTMAMYIGELDFSSMPMGISRGMKHGNVTLTLIHVFVLAFMFFIVMVLGNLLNGLAVSDTGEIIKKAGVLQQISLIRVLKYGETLIIGGLGRLNGVAHKLPKLKGFLEKTIIAALSSLLLINSCVEFISDRFPQLEVIVPLIISEDFSTKTYDKDSNSVATRFCNSFSKLFNYIMRRIPFCDEELNYGCEDFLNEARMILKKKRLAKIQQRKNNESKRKEKEYLRALIREELKFVKKHENEDDIQIVNNISQIKIN